MLITATTKKPPGPCPGGRDQSSRRHQLKELLMTRADLFICEGRLHVEFNAEHGTPGSKVLKQHLGALRLTNDHTTTGLGTVGPADQFKAIDVITLRAAGHVVDQLGVGSFLTFNLRELPGHVVELHRQIKRAIPSNTASSQPMLRQTQ